MNLRVFQCFLAFFSCIIFLLIFFYMVLSKINSVCLRVFIKNLSMIFQFSSQNHDHLNSCSFFPSKSHVQKLQTSTYLNNFFPKSFTTHLETSHGTLVCCSTLVCCNTPAGSHCSRRNCLLIHGLTSQKNKNTDIIAKYFFHSHLGITINEKDLNFLYL